MRTLAVAGHAGWRELRRLLAAVQFFTRVPVPAWVGHSQGLLDDAARYFPLVGTLVGAVGAGSWALAGRFWAPPVAVVISLIATVLFTGGFHEDGLADACDGLGGGHERERVLQIMKDSRIGAYGAMALGLAFLLKFATLSAMSAHTVLLALLAGHTVSRCGAVLIMASLPYCRDAADSRSRPLVNTVSRTSVSVALLTTALLIIATAPRLWRAAAAVLVVALVWRRYLRQRLGGYTGDCLGAATQLGECAFYLAVAAT